MKQNKKDVGEQRPFVDDFNNEARDYLRMKVMEPLKFVTETDERPSPTSPTTRRPSPSVLKPLFQN